MKLVHLNSVSDRLRTLSTQTYILYIPWIVGAIEIVLITVDFTQST